MPQAPKQDSQILRPPNNCDDKNLSLKPNPCNTKATKVRPNTCRRNSGIPQILRRMCDSNPVTTEKKGDSATIHLDHNTW